MALLGLALACACGPAPKLGPASPADLDALARLADAGESAFAASGRARFRSPDGEVEGEVDLRVAPPDRVWLEVRARALFGMVGERIVVALPGDGFLIVHEARADHLERVPFDSSLAGALAPRGGPDLLLALARGKVPRALLGEAPASRARAGPDPGTLRVDLGTERGGGYLLLQLEAGDLRSLEWRVGDERRLQVRYGRYAVVGADRIPTRLEVEAPAAGVRAEIELRRLEPRAGFGPADFQLGRAWNPAQDRGVDRG